MPLLLTGLVLFFVPHTVSIINEPWRNRMAARLGETNWKLVYSVISLVGLILIIWGYGLARQHPAILYVPPPWLRHVTWLLMLPVFTLLIAAYAPGRIRSATRHPMLLAVIFWGAGHLLANGAVADVLLFGTFLVWAIADRISMSRRVQRPLPELPPMRVNDAIAVIGGLALYGLFIFGLHGALFGVPLMRGG